MALETGTNVGDLVITNPTANDPKSAGDDHLRLIKSVLKNSFAGYSAEISVRGTEAQGTTVNDYTVTVSPAPSAYTIGTLVSFKATHANTSGTTLQINALGTKTLLDSNGTALPSGAILSGSVCQALYDGTNFYLISANGHLTSATPTAGDSSTKIATTAFVAATSFTSVLPGQTGNSGKFLTTDGSAASWVTNLAFPSGTTLAGFVQSTAPTGWTKVTTYDDCALRVVSGAVSTGGTVAFSTAFGSANTVDGHNITTAEMPTHTHTAVDVGHTHTLTDPGHFHGTTQTAHSHSITDPGHTHPVPTLFQAGAENGVSRSSSANTPTVSFNTTSNTTGISINTASIGLTINGAYTSISANTGYTGLSINTTGSGSSHNHTLSNLAVKYVDSIICVKT